MRIKLTFFTLIQKERIIINIIKNIVKRKSLWDDLFVTRHGSAVNIAEIFQSSVGTY